MKMSKQQIISAKILSEINSGKSLKDAIDSVLGQGQYEKLAGNVWETLNAK